MHSTDEKIIEIETTLGFHDKTMQDLSDMINQQWKEIDFLKRQLETANGKIQELQSNTKGENDDSSNVKPPHW